MPLNVIVRMQIVDWKQLHVRYCLSGGVGLEMGKGWRMLQFVTIPREHTRFIFSLLPSHYMYDIS